VVAASTDSIAPAGGSGNTTSSSSAGSAVTAPEPRLWATLHPAGAVGLDAAAWQRAEACLADFRRRRGAAAGAAAPAAAAPATSSAVPTEVALLEAAGPRLLAAFSGGVAGAAS
jgi:hypothetical protein